LSETTGRSALRQRAAAANGGPTSGAIAVREPGAQTLSERIEKLEMEFARALPSGEARQLVQDALTCTRTIRNLDRAEPRSVLGALMTCAQLGLRPGLLGHAWPLPFWDRNADNGRGGKGAYKAQLIIGYQGFVHLGYESNRVSLIKATVVREEDDFDWDEGSNEPPQHRRPKLGRPRGPVIGYYSTVRTTTGGVLVYVMDVPEILQHRDRHAPRNKDGKITGPWAGEPESDDFIGMALKTTIRRNAKYMPKSAQFARAEAADGSVRVDVSALSEVEAVSQRPALMAGPDGDEPQEPIIGEMADQPPYDPGQEPAGWSAGRG
jgi:recombination protein RecT